MRFFCTRLPYGILLQYLPLQLFHKQMILLLRRGKPCADFLVTYLARRGTVQSSSAPLLRCSAGCMAYGALGAFLSGSCQPFSFSLSLLSAGRGVKSQSWRGSWQRCSWMQGEMGWDQCLPVAELLQKSSCEPKELTQREEDLN